MTIGSLFAGIGGFELAAQWAGLTPVWSNEIDPFCCKVLRKNFKHRIIEDDIRNIGAHNLEPVDILTGGFPCQSFSVAGKGELDLTLWKEYFRIIREIKPAYIVAENVPGIISRGNGSAIESVYKDLESSGYETIPPIILPAGGVSSPQYRYRVWIVAHTNEVGCREQAQKPLLTGRATAELCSWWSLEPEVVRVAYGLPNQLDEGRGLGNAIVPQVAYEIFRAILSVDVLQMVWRGGEEMKGLEIIPTFSYI